MFEKYFEKILFAARWLLAPVYLGLGLALIALAVKFFQEAGARDIYCSRTALNSPGHLLGTARMGRDPKTSVLNGWNQVHTVPNVFVTDGACMASASCVNPSLTYMALTARAADHAVAELKKGNI